MKSPISFLTCLVVGAIVFYFWKRRAAATMPQSTFYGQPATQASADRASITNTMLVTPSNVNRAFQAGDTISLSGTPSAGDFGVVNKFLGTTTPIFIPRMSFNPSP